MGGGTEARGVGSWFSLLFKPVDLHIFLQVEDQVLCLGMDQITPLHLIGAYMHTCMCCSHANLHVLLMQSKEGEVICLNLES